jgi:hypothetical protein
MNERQPYEKLIADKLQQLRGPDVNTSWDQMKRLLDDDQQPKGGGRKKGPGGWWGIGIIAIVLTTGLLFYVQSNKSSNKNIAAVQNNGDKDNAAAATTTDNNNQKNNTTGETSTLANSSVTKEDNKKDANGTAATTAGIATEAGKNEKDIKADANNNLTGKTAGTAEVKNIKVVTEDGTAATDKTNNGVAVTNKNEAKNRKPVIASTAGNKYNTGTTHVNDVAANNRKAAGGLLNDNAVGATTGNSNSNLLMVKNSTGTNNKKDRAKRNVVLKDESGNGIATTGNNTIARERQRNHTAGSNGKNNQTSGGNTLDGNVAGDKMILSGMPVPDPTQGASLNGEDAGRKAYVYDLSGLVMPYEYELANTSGIIEGNIAGNRPTNNLLSKEARDLAIKNKFAAADKKRKSLNINLADVFMPFSLKRDGEPWWAVGLSLNSSMAVAGQSRYNYNVNAKSGTLTDYLPSPYVQYHMNDYVYVQTELNLSTPQHVPQLLVSQFSAQNPVTQGTIQTSIYIQKLYYFNWPFSLHYSPVKNLYIAGGLQFSSLQSGIAMREQKELYVSNPSAPNTFVYKFKDDSTAARFTPTEWRWETGADYYISRFTLGFRYNKAFKDAINLNVSSALPQTINRNTSFMLFMKYNLFEGKNKDNAGPRSSLVRY